MGKSWANPRQILGVAQVSLKTKCDFTHLVVPRTWYINDAEKDTFINDDEKF